MGRTASIPCTVLLAMAASLAPTPVIGQATAPDCVFSETAAQHDFLGSPKRVSPDLQSDPAALLIEQQLGHGECTEAARAGLASYLAAHPTAPAATYLQLRAAVLAGRGEASETALRELVTSQPQMHSAKVLLASLLLDTEQRVAALALLEQVASDAPDSLYGAFQMLRVRALNAPKGPGVGDLFKVLRNPRLPTDMRETAQVTLLYITALDHAQKEAALREAMGFQSQTPMWTKGNNLARLLAEESGKTAEARVELQKVLAMQAAPAAALDHARLLLAETWLMDAAAIDPVPSAANAALVERARAQLNGNMTPLAKRVATWHHLGALRPFVGTATEAPDSRDDDGLTMLCKATQQLDASAVTRALEAGAAVDGECAGATAVAFVVRAGPGDFPRKRAVLAALLRRGADPDPRLYAGSSYTAMSFCADGFPDCTRELLPLLVEARAARAAAVSSPK